MKKNQENALLIIWYIAQAHKMLVSLTSFPSAKMADPSSVNRNINNQHSTLSHQV